ncbi:MAG: aldo/keto reductase [Dehalococcoidales bacterium]
MEKIKLGKTGMMVTRLGFGGIPIQRLNEADAVKVVQKCLDLGINYLDTANGYSTSEERIGKAVKGRRHDVFIATKTFPGTPDIIEKNLELSLKRLDTDYIDLYQFHGINDKATLDKILDPENGLYKVFEKAKKAGKIRHIGITSHQMDAAKLEIKSGRFETIMFPFNFITNEPAKELLPLCREQEMGFIVMKPLAGGMLDNATIAFKYLLQFPDVVAIPGIEKVHEIEEIAAIYEGTQKITAAERKEMKRMTEELGTRFCRRCDYCQPCAQGIPISLIMTFPTFVKRLPPDWYLKSPFIPDGMAKAASCTECGECETRCPFKLPIREMIKEGYNLFEQVKAANTK